MNDCLEVLVCQRCGRDVVLGGTAGHVCARCVDGERRTLRRHLATAHSALKGCLGDFQKISRVCEESAELARDDVKDAARLLTPDELRGFEDDDD